MSSAGTAAIDPADPATWLARWNLEADGEPLKTHSSLLMPVRRDGVPAMLKLAHEVEERRGCRLMAWWGGNAAACVLAEDEGVLLLERATGPRSLTAMAHAGYDEDDEAKAMEPGRFAHQIEIIANAAVLDRARLLQWMLAFAGLSAVWTLGDGDTPTLDLAVAELAFNSLQEAGQSSRMRSTSA